ncbi:hypothetical protein V8F20_007909 [Naviculisporaceae sp. PSN 640]
MTPLTRPSSHLLHSPKLDFHTTVVDYGSEKPNTPEPLGQRDGDRAWIVRWKDEIVADLRSANWSRITLGYLLGAWILGLFFLCTTIPVYLYWWGVSYSLSFEIETSDVGCLPNDVFNARDRRYNIFDPSGFFQITHGFGSLTFTGAKLADLSWDIIVGRGGQSMLAYFSWKAFSAHFKNQMNKEPVSYNLYWTMFIQDQPSFQAVWQTIRDTCRRQTRRSKAALVFVILNMIFILAFPTLVSAMTGYRPNNKAFVLDHNKNLISFDKFVLAKYIIHDGHRMGHQHDHIVPCTVRFGSCVEEEAHQTWKYVKEFGFFGLNNETGDLLNITTTFGETELDPPALNISAFYLSKDEFGYDWTDPRTNTKPFSNESNAAMYQTGTPSTTYTYDYIQEHGSCVQQQTYKWGFSFLQVFVMSILLLIWTCGTFVMWLGAHKALVQHVDRDVPSGFKAAYMLATSLNLQLAGIHKSTALLTTKQLSQIVERDLAGRGIMTEEVTTLESANYSMWRACRVWMKHHPWWSVWLTVLTAYLTWWPLLFYSVWLAIMYGHFSVVALHLGSVIALAVGSTRKTQALFIFLGAAVGVLIWTTVLYYSIR